MKKHNRTYVIYIPFFVAALYALCNFSYAHAARAGLDYTIEVTDEDETKIVDCDICNYASFADNNTFFQTRTVDKQSEYVEIIFFKKTDYTPQYTGSQIDYNDVTIIQDQEFFIDYHKVFRIKEGQIVKLQGTNIKLKVINVFGKWSKRSRVPILKKAVEGP